MKTFTKEEEQKLYEWLKIQQKAEKNGELSPEKISKLDNLDIKWREC